MKQLNNKEEKLKDILGGLEIDIDTNDIWANIESDLPSPEKKRRFGFFWLFAIVGLGLMSSYLLIDNSDTTTSLSASSILDSTNDENSTKYTAISEAKIMDSEKESSSKINNTNKIESTEIAEVENSKKLYTTNSRTNSNSQINRAQANTSPFTTKRNNIISTNHETKTSANFDIRNTTSLTTTQSVLPIVNIKSEDRNENRETLSNVENVSTLSTQVLDIIERSPIDGMHNFVQPITTQGRQLVLQMKFGANQNRTTISNINSTGEFDSSEFDFERDRIGVSGSFAIGVENKGWRFLAGAAYHHHVSTYERDDVQIFTNPVTGVEYFRIDDAGATTATNGITNVTGVRDNDISFHRQHRAIDFFATVGKRLWSYKGLVLVADAGLGINTTTHSNGYYLQDAAFGFTKIENGNSPYIINTHWNAIASIELGYDFGKSRIGLSPFIRYNPNSITEQTHLYSLKNSQVGLQLSLTYSPTRE